MKTTCVVLLLALSFSTTALAADDDVVWLTDGGRVRGDVIEESPTNGVRVKLLDGTVRTYAAGQVKKIDYGGTAPSSAAAPANSQPAPTNLAAPGPGAPAVKVHIEADNPGVVLELINATIFLAGSGGYAGGTDSTTVCVAPCDLVVDGNREYRVSGKGYMPSAFFLLPRQPNVTLEVETGDQDNHLLGFMGGTLALTAAICGGAFMLGGLVADKDEWAIGGGVTMGIGLAAAVPLFILMANSKTHVKTKEGTELALSDDIRLTTAGLTF